MKQAEEVSAAKALGRRPVPIGVMLVGMVAVAWWPAFTLGAWGELFFDDLLALWAVSTAALVYVLIEKRPVGAKLARALVLLLPSVWLLLNFFVNSETTDLGLILFDLVALAAVLVGTPFTLIVLVGIMWPEFSGTMKARTKWVVAAVVLAVVVASFVLGLHHPHFLTCDDFTISGNSEPPGCTPVPD